MTLDFGCSYYDHVAGLFASCLSDVRDRRCIGYARVSTTDQDLTLQIDALTKAGCERLFTDKASGAKTDRPGLGEALQSARAGDALVVWKLDRLGSSIQGLIAPAAGLSVRNVDFRSLTDGSDTATLRSTTVPHPGLGCRDGT